MTSPEQSLGTTVSLLRGAESEGPVSVVVGTEVVELTSEIDVDVEELVEEVVLIVEVLVYKAKVSFNGRSLSSFSPLLYLLASTCATRKRVKHTKACILCPSIQAARVSYRIPQSKGRNEGRGKREATESAFSWPCLANVERDLVPRISIERPALVAKVSRAGIIDSRVTFARCRRNERTKEERVEGSLQLKRPSKGQDEKQSCVAGRCPLHEVASGAPVQPARKYPGLYERRRTWARNGPPVAAEEPAKEGSQIGFNTAGGFPNCSRPCRSLYL